MTKTLAGRRIYVDIDDILCETAHTLCGLAARHFGCRTDYESIGVFDLQQAFGLSDDQMVRFMSLSHEPSCLMSYPQTPGAVEGVLALRAAGATVDILTGRPSSAHVPTESWMAAVGLGDFRVEYVDKYARTYERNADDPPMLSLDALLARQYDFAIDDSPVILRKLEGWSQTRVLVFDRPWNRTYGMAPNMTRVRDWPAIVDIIMRGSRAPHESPALGDACLLRKRIGPPHPCGRTDDKMV